MNIESVGTHEQVDALDDVQEDFVLTVADTFGPPRDSIRDRNWWPDLDLELVRLLSDISRGIARPSAHGIGETASIDKGPCARRDRDN